MPLYAWSKSPSPKQPSSSLYIWVGSESFNVFRELSTSFMISALTQDMFTLVAIFSFSVFKLRRKKKNIFMRSAPCQSLFHEFFWDWYVMWNQGAPLTEYTLRLIGSDIEHYIRKLLYDGEIKYNMNARVLNFSMGKPRILFNDGLPQNVQWWYLD